MPGEVPRGPLTVAVAARRAQVSEAYLTQCLRAQRIVGEKVDDRWLVDEQSLRAWMAARRRAGRSTSPCMGSPRHPRVPAAPLLRFVLARGGPAACGASEGTAAEQALLRARRRGWLTVWTADDLAVHLLGMSPVEVWGDDWLATAG